MTEFLTLRRKIRLFIWKCRRAILLTGMVCLATTISLLLLADEVTAPGLSDSDFWLVMLSVISAGLMLLLLISVLNE